MPDNGQIEKSGPNLGGGIRRRTQEASQQVVQIEDGAKILALYDELDTMPMMVRKLTKAMEDLKPETARGQRSLPALCRLLMDIWFRSQAVNQKMAKENQVEEIPVSLLGYEDEEVLAMGRFIKERRAAKEDAVETETEETS